MVILLGKKASMRNRSGKGGHWGFDRSLVTAQVCGRQNDVGNLWTISVGTSTAHQPRTETGEIPEIEMSDKLGEKW